MVDTSSYKDLGWISDNSARMAVPLYAGVLSRIFAFIVDFIFLSIICHLALVFIAPGSTVDAIRERVAAEIISQSLDPLSFISSVFSLIFYEHLITVALVSLISALYFTAMIASPLQCTVGMWIAAIHVIDKFGAKLSLLHSLWRFVCSVVFVVAPALFCMAIMPYGLQTFGVYYNQVAYIITFSGFLSALLNKKNVALHDRFCGTRVMQGKAGIYKVAHYEEEEEAVQKEIERQKVKTEKW